MPIFALSMALRVGDIPLTEVARKSLIKQRERSMLLGKTAKIQEVEGISYFIGSFQSISTHLLTVLTIRAILSV